MTEKTEVAGFVLSSVPFGAAVPEAHEEMVVIVAARMRTRERLEGADDPAVAGLQANKVKVVGAEEYRLLRSDARQRHHCQHG